jgi:hypothetical protein
MMSMRDDVSDTGAAGLCGWRHEGGCGGGHRGTGFGFAALCAIVAGLILAPGAAGAVSSFAVQTGEVCAPLPSCWADQADWFVRPMCRNWAQKPAALADLRRMAATLRDAPGGAEKFIRACANFGVRLR